MKGLIFCSSCGLGFHEDSLVWHKDKPFCLKCQDVMDDKSDLIRKYGYD